MAWTALNTSSDAPPYSPIEIPFPVTRPIRCLLRSQPQQLHPVPETTVTPHPSADPANKPSTASFTASTPAPNPNVAITCRVLSLSEGQSYPATPKPAPQIWSSPIWARSQAWLTAVNKAVSYTHLTLPTIYSV